MDQLGLRSTHHSVANSQRVTCLKKDCGNIMSKWIFLTSRIIKIEWHNFSYLYLFKRFSSNQSWHHCFFIFSSFLIYREKVQSKRLRCLRRLPSSMLYLRIGQLAFIKVWPFCPKTLLTWKTWNLPEPTVWQPQQSSPFHLRCRA